MNIFKKRGFQMAILGGVFGGLLIVNINFLPNIVSLILGFLVVWIGFSFSSGILTQACRFSEDPNWCSAGVLDGGPNDWFITLSIYIVSVLFYAFIFWVIYKIYHYLKNKKRAA